MTRTLTKILGVFSVLTLSIAACGADVDDEEQADEPEGFTDSALMQTRCNPKELVAGCSCDEVSRRYQTQFDVCRAASNGSRCTASTSCDATDRVMRTSRSCINARYQLARCYRQPTAGLQSMISAQCSRFRACIPKSTACGIDAPALPAACR